jgi:hypothetical protein
MTGDGSLVCLVGKTVLKVSPPEFPDVIKQMTFKARLARTALGDNLGSRIPTPLCSWEMNGVTCALFEKLTPISNNGVRFLAKRRKVTRDVLAWLRDVAELDRGPSDRAVECVRALADCPYPSLSDAAKYALIDMNAGGFAPRSAVMHGDLWLGNVLLCPSGVRDFVIIDWRGSTTNGFPIFDLVRFAGSVGLSPREMHGELVAHAERLKCELAHTRTYVLAALGHIWMNLDQFPPERFACMAKRSLAQVEDALRLTSNKGELAFANWQRHPLGRKQPSADLAPRAS